MRVHKSKQLVVAGDNKGQVFLLPVNQLGQNVSTVFNNIIDWFII